MTATGVKDKTAGTGAAPSSGRWRRWAIGTSLALALLLAVLVAIPIVVWMSRDAIINSDWVRAAMLDRVEVALSRRPQWEGGVTLDWIIDPRTDVRDPVQRSQIILTLGAGALPSPAGFSGQPLTTWNRIQLVIDGGALRALVNGDRWQIRKLEIDGLELHGETNLAGEHNWEGLFANPATAPTPSILIERLTLPQMAVHHRAADGSRFSLMTQGLQLEQLQRSPAGAWKLPQLRLTTRDGAQLGLSDVTLTDASQKEVVQAASFTMQWQIQKLSLRSLPLRELSVPTWFTENEAALFVPLARGRLAVGRDGTKIEVESMRIDHTSIKGEIFSTPAGVDLGLQLGRLQLDSYLGQSTISRPREVNAALSDMLPIEALRNLGLRGDIEIEELAWGGDRIRGLNVQIRP